MKISRGTLVITAFAFATLLGALASVLFAVNRTQALPTVNMTLQYLAQLGRSAEWPAQPPATAHWPSATNDAEAHEFGHVMLEAHAVDATHNSTHHMQVSRLGWPLPVLERIELNRKDENRVGDKWVRYDLGFTVMWVNLAAQSVGIGLFGAGFAIGIFAIQALRIRSRTRRGECVACRHPLANLPTCPECGTPAPQASRANGFIQ